MTSDIQLVVETEMTNDDGYAEEPFMLVHVIPLIDGEPYIADYKANPFESLAVYGQGLKSGEVWPFNCECGFAACARFDEPRQLIAEETLVHWRFPEQPYDDKAVSSSGIPKSRKITFDLTQYQSAFEQLIAELKDLEGRHGHLMIHPIPPGKFSVEETISIQKNNAEYRALLRASLGDLDRDDVDVVVTAQSGLELVTPLSQIVYETVSPYRLGGMYDLANTSVALFQLAEDLRVDPGQTLKRLDVHRLSVFLRATPRDELEETEPVPYWTSDDSPREHIETWLKIQKTAKVSLRGR